MTHTRLRELSFFLIKYFAIWVLVVGWGLAILLGTQAFQTSSVSPTSTGTGTTDDKNTSVNFPMLTKLGGVFNRESMSLQAIATQAKLAADSASSASANAGLYSNQIFSGTVAVPYTEVCFKWGTRTQDYHAWTNESTVGGNCSPGDTGFIIEKTARAAATWSNAKATCLILGMRLPEVFELQYTCNNTGVFGTTLSNAFEWSSNSTWDMYNGSYMSVVSHALYFNAACTNAGYGRGWGVCTKWWC